MLWSGAKQYDGLAAFAEVEFADMPISIFFWGLATTAAIELVYILNVLAWRHESIAEFLGLSFEFEDAILGVGLIVAGHATSFVVLTWVAPTPNVDGDAVSSQLPMTFTEATETELLAFILLVGLAIPFIEEVLFRGMLLRAIEVNWGPVLAVVVSSVVFGVVHVATFTNADLPIIANAFALGLLYPGSTEMS